MESRLRTGRKDRSTGALAIVSLAYRLALLAALFTFGLVLGTTELTLRWAAEARLNDLRRQAEALGETWAAYLTDESHPSDWAGMAALLAGWPSDHLTATRATVFARTAGGLGRVAGTDSAATRPSPGDSLALVSQSIQVWRTGGDDPAWRVALPIGSRIPYAVLDVAVSTASLEAQSLAERRRAYALAAAAAAILSLGLGWLVRRWVGRPLGALEAAMEETRELGLPVAERNVALTGPREFRRLARRYAELETALRLRQQRLALEERTRSLERIALAEQAGAEFAHEIGTPLNTVGGHLQLLREDLERSPGREPLVARVDAVLGQVDRLSGIVRAKLGGAAWTHVNPQAVPLGPFLHRVVGFMEPTLRDAGVAVVLPSPAEDGTAAMADPNLLEQVLVNLLKNAVEAMPGGGQVRITTGRSDAEAWIEVADTGPGLSPAARQSLFQPFASSKGRAGTGLGLAVSRRLARVMKGELDPVASEAGARWRITLPAANEPEPPR